MRRRLRPTRSPAPSALDSSTADLSAKKKALVTALNTILGGSSIYDTTRFTNISLSAETEEFAQQISDQVESFLLAVRAIARGEATGGEAISLLLLVVSQVLLAGGRLGVQADFQPAEEYEPDAGPDPDA